MLRAEEMLLPLWLFLPTGENLAWRDGSMWAGWETFSKNEMRFCILQLKLLSKMRQWPGLVLYLPIVQQPATERGKLISLYSSKWDHKVLETAATDGPKIERLLILGTISNILNQCIEDL